MPRIFRHCSEHFSFEIVEDDKARLMQTYSAMPIMRGVANDINKSEISSFIAFLEFVSGELNKSKEGDL